MHKPGCQKQATCRVSWNGLLEAKEVKPEQSVVQAVPLERMMCATCALEWANVGNHKTPGMVKIDVWEHGGKCQGKDERMTR